MVTRPAHDVVVVGAGPAGSAAAISLAERGWRVLLVDKATFPRDKVCGDFVSPRSLAVLTALGCFDELRRVQPREIRRSMVHLNGDRISSGPMPAVGDLPGFGLVIPRTVLDEIIFRRAAAAGATVVEGFTATGLDVRADRACVHGHGPAGPATLDARLVVVADGARSRLAAGLGVTPVDGQRDLFALRAYYRDVPSAPDTTAIFFDADYFPGYAWVFPTGDGGANVGMGMVMDVSRRYGINLRERFLRWLDHDPGLRDMLGGASRHGKIVGWPLTGYLGDHGNYGDRVLVVGDAGRFIDPINGEGIHTALESARLAATVADEALTTGDARAAALSVYEQRWRAKFDLDLRTSDLLVTVSKNRALMPLWLLVIRMVAQRSTVDRDFAATCGGIMAGVVPSHQGLSFGLAVRAAIHRPDFWLRHQAELRQAWTALLTAGAQRDSGADRAAETMDWLREVTTKSATVSEGLTATYGVPWVAASRPRRRPATPPAPGLPDHRAASRTAAGAAMTPGHPGADPGPPLRSLLAAAVAGNLRLASQLNALAWERALRFSGGSRPGRSDVLATMLEAQLQSVSAAVTVLGELADPRGSSSRPPAEASPPVPVPVPCESTSPAGGPRPSRSRSRTSTTTASTSVSRPIRSSLRRCRRCHST